MKPLLVRFGAAFGVLRALARNPGQLMTKNALLDAVWGHQHVSESVLKTTISELRAALEDDAKTPRYIETASRHGYRFIGRSSAAAVVTGVPAPLPVDTAIIGREAALAKLRQAWQTACNGRHQLVWRRARPPAHDGRPDVDARDDRHPHADGHRHQELDTDRRVRARRHGEWRVAARSDPRRVPQTRTADPHDHRGHGCGRAADRAAARCMRPLLEDGQLSVGVGIEVKHTAATPPGMMVRATAKCESFDGRLYHFRVEAFDEAGPIGEGVHTRAIIATERLLAGAARRFRPISA